MAKAGLHEVKPCEECGANYRQSRSDQRYCSGKCNSRAWRTAQRPSDWNPRQPRPGRVERDPQVCARCDCGKFFVPKTKTHLYCSLPCKQGLNGLGKEWSKGKQYVPRRLCEVCETTFYAPPVLIRRGGGRFCSVNCRAKHIGNNPKMWPHTQGRRGNGGRRPDLEDRYFRSAWEANWARYLNWLVERKELVRWEYEVDTFEFPVKRGSRFYTPDFKLHYPDGSVLYHEVKGYMDQRSATKLKRMKTHHPKIDIRLIDKTVYNQVSAQVRGFIPNWEGRLRAA